MRHVDDGTRAGYLNRVTLEAVEQDGTAMTVYACALYAQLSFKAAARVRPPEVLSCNSFLPGAYAMSRAGPETPAMQIRVMARRFKTAVVSM